MNHISVGQGVSVPERELEFRAARSGGPGGQSVNVTDSKIELRWDVAQSGALNEQQRSRLLAHLASRLTTDGVLILTGSEHKSQLRNREAVVARFRSIVAEALTPPKRRGRTRPTRASKERRLRGKKQRGELKRLRQPPEG